MDLTEKQLDLQPELLKNGRSVLRALNHPLRQTIIRLIDEKARITVTEIYTRLHLEQSVASQHLAILRRQGFVVTERTGKFIFYAVNYQRLTEVEKKCIELTKPEQ